MPIPRHPGIKYYEVADAKYRQVDRLMSSIKNRLGRPEGSWIDPDELIKVLEVFSSVPPRLGEGPKVVIASLPPRSRDLIDGPLVITETRPADPYPI